MSAGMAGVIAAHRITTDFDCACGSDFYPEDEAREEGPESFELAWEAHVAEELTKAGYGNAQEALLAAADGMPIETLGGADKASVWLRQRAHSLDPEGRALVQAIHDWKAGVSV
ncbi:hypothetical protein [Arthrobacter sp. Z1-15]